MKSIKKIVLFFLILAMLCSVLTACGKSASYEEQVLGLEKVKNARQLGGYVIGNKKVRMNKLLRSGDLGNATEEDIQKLKDLGLVLDIDFRRVSEITKTPDKEIAGAEFVNLDIIGALGTPVGYEEPYLAFAQAPEGTLKSIFMSDYPVYVDFTVNMVENFLFDSECQKLYKEMFDLILAENGGTVLWHCTTGKDRTGAAGILLLGALGADDATIKEDYLRTNLYYAENIEKGLALAKEKGFSDQQVLCVKCTEGVAEETIDKVLNRINTEFGGMHSFLLNQIGITDADMEKLRSWYLE